jgi:uncharacterized membrane protein
MLIYRGFSPILRVIPGRDARVHTAASESAFDLTVKRNCSISPQDLLWVLAFLSCVSLGIASVFAYFGAWPVLPFAGIEVLAIAVAFYLNGRHAADYEHIALAEGRLVVEKSDAGHLRRHEFSVPWLRIEERRHGGDLRLVLRSGRASVEVGRHLDTERRASLAAHLRRSFSNR